MRGTIVSNFLKKSCRAHNDMSGNYFCAVSLRPHKKIIPLLRFALEIFPPQEEREIRKKYQNEKGSVVGLCFSINVNKVAKAVAERKIASGEITEKDAEKGRTIIMLAAACGNWYSTLPRQVVENSIKFIESLDSMNKPTLEVALAHGLEDTSYSTVRYGWVTRYEGNKTFSLPNGSIWRATGKSTRGTAEILYSEGGYKITRIIPRTFCPTCKKENAGGKKGSCATCCKRLRRDKRTRKFQV